MNILRLMIPKSQVVYITSDCTVRQALEKMRFHRYTAIPVLDGEGKYVGTLRSDDIFRYFLDEGTFDKRSAEEDSVLSILDKFYSKAIEHNAHISELFELVKEHNFVPVVDDRACFIGIVLRRSVVDYLLEFYTDDDERLTF